MLLYEHHANRSIRSNPLVDTEFALKELGTSGISRLLPNVVAYASHIQTILPFNSDQVSPLVIHCLYRCAFRLLESTPKSQHEDANQDLSIILTTLRKLDQKWRLAGKILLLKAIVLADFQRTIY